MLRTLADFHRGPWTWMIIFFFMGATFCFIANVFLAVCLVFRSEQQWIVVVVDVAIMTAFLGIPGAFFYYLHKHHKRQRRPC